MRLAIFMGMSSKKYPQCVVFIKKGHAIFSMQFSNRKLLIFNRIIRRLVADWI
jgi:hypothetical protein